MFTVLIVLVELVTLGPVHESLNDRLRQQRSQTFPLSSVLRVSLFTFCHFDDDADE